MLNKINVRSRAYMLLSCILLFSCEGENEMVQLFQAPVFGATSTSTDILRGESVTFTDTSTLVVSRQWSFPFGNPASSTDSVVNVIYPSGGKFEAALTVRHIDNQEFTKKFFVDVEGPEIKTFGFYSEAPTVSFGEALAFEANNAFNITAVTTEKFEGDRSIEFQFTQEDTWGVQGSLRPTSSSTLDISEFAGGTYSVAMKTSSQLPMLLRLHTNSGTEQRAILELDPADEPYGLKRDGEWHQLDIPIQDFIDANDQIDLTAVTHILVLRSGTESVASTEDWDWYVDNFFLQLELE